MRSFSSTLCFCLVMVCHWSFAQQRMSIAFSNQTSQTMPVNSIRKITFANGNLTVTSTSGNTQDFSINTIKTIRFTAPTITSKEDVSFGRILVYPNPTQGDLIVTLPSPGVQLVSFSLVHISGQRFFENVETPVGLDGSIDLGAIFSSSALQTGIYFLTMTIEEKTHYFKILKY